MATILIWVQKRHEIILFLLVVLGGVFGLVAFAIFKFSSKNNF